MRCVTEKDSPPCEALKVLSAVFFDIYTRSRDHQGVWSDKSYGKRSHEFALNALAYVLIYKLSRG